MRQAVFDIAEKCADWLINLPFYAEPLDGKIRPPLVIGHRGAWNSKDLPENTMAAFLKAQEVGADGIEFDVRFSKDGVAVVHHDSSLERIFGHRGSIESMSFSEIRSAAAQVPTLEEVLVLAGLHFMIEIKESLNESQLRELNRLLSKKRPRADYHLLAIDPDLVKETSASPAQAWILVGELNLKSRLELSLSRGYAGVAGHYLGLSRRDIERLHEHDQKAGVGFVPTRNLLCREWARGIDWAFTNRAASILPLKKQGPHGLA